MSCENNCCDTELAFELIGAAPDGKAHHVAVESLVKYLAFFAKKYLASQGLMTLLHFLLC